MLLFSLFSNFCDTVEAMLSAIVLLCFSIQIFGEMFRCSEQRPYTIHGLVLQSSPSTKESHNKSSSELFFYVLNFAQHITAGQGGPSEQLLHLCLKPARTMLASFGRCFSRAVNHQLEAPRPIEADYAGTLWRNNAFVSKLFSVVYDDTASIVRTSGKGLWSDLKWQSGGCESSCALTWKQILFE